MKKKSFSRFCYMSLGIIFLSVAAMAQTQSPPKTEVVSPGTQNTASDLPAHIADKNLPDVKVEQERWEDISTPLKTVLSIDSLPALGETANLTCQLTSAENAPETTVRIELPSDVQLLEGNLSWQGNLSANDEILLSAKVQFNTAGDQAIFCRAIRIIDAENSWGDLASLYLSIGQVETLSHYAPILDEERDQLGGTNSGTEQLINNHHGFPAPSDSPEPPSTIPSDSSSLENAFYPYLSGELTITGRWQFHDRDDNLASEQMLVEIVRGDNSNHLAWCYTDIDGYYSCGPFTNPGSAGVRSRFLSYASFTPYSDRLVTINPDWGTVGNASNAFGVTTPVKTFSNGTHDIGAWYLINDSTYERAYWITADLIKVWKYIWFGTGSSQSPQETSGSSTVEWKIDSTDGTYYRRGENIHLDGEDPLSNTVVGHEYGHNMMYTVYGDWMPTTYCPSPHYIQRKSHVNCAWTEGWANFITIAANNDPVYRWSSGASLNLETPTWGTSGWDEGDDVEGRVAGALWDILDNVNDGDDQYSDGGIANIWDTLYHQNDNNLSEFWSAWQSRGHNASTAPVLSIYQNTIDYRPPGGGSKLQFSLASYSLAENSGQATITVTRTDHSYGAVSVEYATSDDTATHPDDYIRSAGTLYWSDGDTSNKTFLVSVIDDSQQENDETFIVSLGNPTGGAQLGTPDTAVVTIKDNDATEFSCKKVTGISKKECDALVALYDSTDGENWMYNTGWKATNSPCNWYGVTCRSQHVTGLSLGNNNLKGSISTKFFKLKNLEELVLSDNELNGTNFKNFKKLKKLETLLLNNCKLSGKIPNSLMKLKKLTELDLNDNCFLTKVSKRLGKWLDELNPGWDETQMGCFE